MARRREPGDPPRAPRPERVAAHFTGLSAESRAAAYLIARGYRIVARRFRTPVGEIDIVARRRDTIVFVEVKARGLMDDALTAVTAAKRRRFSRAARVWLARHPWAATKTWRADAVFIAPRRWPQHVAAAFELEMR